MKKFVILMVIIFLVLAVGIGYLWFKNMKLSMGNSIIGLSSLGKVQLADENLWGEMVSQLVSNSNIKVALIVHEETPSIDKMDVFQPSADDPSHRAIAGCTKAIKQNNGSQVQVNLYIDNAGLSSESDRNKTDVNLNALIRRCLVNAVFGEGNTYVLESTLKELATNYQNRQMLKIQ